MSAVTREKICNLALTRIGITGQIQNVDTEKSPEAIYSRLTYDICRKEALELNPWNFAKKTAVLAPVDEEPLDYQYAYQMPVDNIRLISFVQPAADLKDLRYEIRGSYIYTDEPNLVIKYIYDCELTATYSPTFVSALAYRLASDLAVPLTGQPEKQQAMYAMFLALKADAEPLNNSGNRIEQDRDRRFIKARGIQ